MLDLIEPGIAVHCLGDLTCGGRTSALVEVAEAARLAVSFEEQSIPVGEAVTAACELPGLDSLHVANEGRFITSVAPEHVERTIVLLPRHAVTSAAAMIGTVAGAPAGQVSCRGPFER